MEAILASDSTRIPSARIRSPPPWNAFSIAMPAPTTLAPACSASARRPTSAAPVARKSSVIRMRSEGLRYSLETMTVFVLPWVKDSTSTE